MTFEEEDETEQETDFASDVNLQMSGASSGVVQRISSEADVQLLHLRDVLFLETKIQQLKNKMNSLESQKKQKEEKLEEFKVSVQPGVPQEPVLRNPDLSYLPQTVIYGLLFLGAIGGAYYLLNSIPFIGDWLAPAAKPLALVLAGITGIIIIGSLLFAISEKSTAKKEYTKAMAEYREDVKWYEEAYRKYEDKVAVKEHECSVWMHKNQQKRKQTVNQIRTYSQLLAETYSANIIPQPFRNLECVYYLYDYLSSSNQTLSEALVQANLDAIKKELKKVVANQAEMIINQRTIIAQNEEQIEIDRKMLDNSRESLKYQQIISEHQRINNEIQKEIMKQNDESLKIERKEEIDRFLRR